MLLYTAADKKLYSYAVADAKTSVISSSDVARIGSVSVSPDSKWVAFSKQDRTLRSHVYIAPDRPAATPATERHLSDDNTMYSETNAVWTADGRYIVFTSAEGASAGIASQGSLPTTMELWATSLVDQDRDPMNRDIDNEAQGLAAEAAARQAAGRGGANAPVPEVKIDWSGLARRARAADRAGDGHRRADRVARRTLDRADGRDRRRRRRTRRGRRGGSERRHVHHQRRERPAHARAAGAADGRRGRWRRTRAAAAAGSAAAARTWCSRATAGRSTSVRAPASTPRRCRRTARRRRGGGRRADGRTRRRWRRAGGGAPTRAATNATARQVTYTANIEVDRKALRAQVFNEGWRIMKNRFYDAKMHGADWNAAWETYGRLLDHVVDREELQTVMMMMIGQLNASHTGVSGGPPVVDSAQQTRHPGFTPRRRRVRLLQGRPRLQGRSGRSRLPQDQGRPLRRRASTASDLKTSDNYWRYFTLAPGTEVPLPDQRQAGEGGRVGGDDQPDRGRRLRRSAVRASGCRIAATSSTRRATARSATCTSAPWTRRRCGSSSWTSPRTGRRRRW